MRTMVEKDVLTTGEVARICRVAPRTVSKWFDSGKLHGYRIPGSRDRRIPLRQLLAFMQAHGIPLDGLDQGTCRVLILASEVPQGLLETMETSDRHEVKVACNGFEAGMVSQRFRPHAVIVDVGDDEGVAEGLCRNIKSSDELQAAKVIAATDNLTPERRQRLLSLGFDGCLSRPITPADLVAAVDEATNLLA